MQNLDFFKSERQRPPHLQDPRTDAKFSKDKREKSPDECDQEELKWV